MTVASPLSASHRRSNVRRNPTAPGAHRIVRSQSARGGHRLMPLEAGFELRHQWIKVPMSRSSVIAKLLTANETNARTGHHTTHRQEVMLIAAWVGGLVLLTLLFQDVLETRFKQTVNPRWCGRARTAVAKSCSNATRRAATMWRTGFINGYPVTFLVDTGATDVALSEALAERLRLQRGGGAISQTANGPVAVWQTVLDQVRIGSIALGDVRASILPTMRADDPVLLG